MTRVILIHWNAAEAEERAKELRRLGYEVGCHSDPRANPKSLCADPPDAFVIDLHRAPSHGRELAGWLRRHKATRGVPIVFIEGDPEKTARVRELLSDATFSSWGTIEADLRCAMRNPPEDPMVPGAMDAYAGVPLPRKLGISSEATVLLVDAPEDFEATLAERPNDVHVVQIADEPADVIVLFGVSEAGREEMFPAATKALAGGGRLWICWPKKASGVPSDLSQAIVRAFGLTRGFVDYKIASIDKTWSGLCFARRLK
jgi:CheY-like chemotaxis protein